MSEWQVVVVVLVFGLGFRATINNLRRDEARKHIARVLRRASDLIGLAQLQLHYDDKETGRMHFMNDLISIVYQREEEDGHQFEWVDILFRQMAGYRWIFGYRDEKVCWWQFKDLADRRGLEPTEVSFLAHEVLTKVRLLALPSPRRPEIAELN